jgi:hypothetical protein
MAEGAHLSDLAVAPLVDGDGDLLCSPPGPGPEERRADDIAVMSMGGNAAGRLQVSPVTQADGLIPLCSGA